MAQIRAIRTESDYDSALVRIAELWDNLSYSGGQSGDLDDPNRTELEVLADLVELYEERHHSIGLPDPISAIEFRMEQANLTQRDLVPLIGSRSKVSEILSGKRDITMSMARALHQHLGIPADVLLQEPGATFPSSMPELEYSRFPLRAMANAGWIPNLQHLKEHAEELITDLMERAGGSAHASATLYRKSSSRRVNAKTDEYALRAWCWQVLAKARENETGTNYQSCKVTPLLLREVAQLSLWEDGPLRAKNLLEGLGISVQYVRHLPRTHLDGAALRLTNGKPAIGLTIRYDRIDNFWFTLMHEMAHVTLHLSKKSVEAGFIDDHSLRRVTYAGNDTTEQEADILTQNALIPPDIWNYGYILENPTPAAVLNMASKARVHPAIVAGRIRFEKENYRLLSQFVGTGEVRKHFEEIECV